MKGIGIEIKTNTTESGKKSKILSLYFVTPSTAVRSSLVVLLASGLDEGSYLPELYYTLDLTGKVMGKRVVLQIQYEI